VGSLCHDGHAPALAPSLVGGNDGGKLAALFLHHLALSLELIEFLPFDALGLVHRINLRLPHVILFSLRVLPATGACTEH